MKPFYVLTVILLFWLCQSCNNESSLPKATSGNEKNFLDPHYFSKKDLMPDTISATEEMVVKKRDGKDSLQTISKPIAYVSIPKRTKKVKWYSFLYTIDGRGYLTLVTFDDSVYKDILVPPTATAATATIIQNPNLRFDTLTKQIITYKSDIDATIKQPIRIFDSYLNIQQ